MAFGITPFFKAEFPYTLPKADANIVLNIRGDTRVISIKELRKEFDKLPLQLQHLYRYLLVDSTGPLEEKGKEACESLGLIRFVPSHEFSGKREIRGLGMLKAEWLRWNPFASDDMNTQEAIRNAGYNLVEKVTRGWFSSERAIVWEPEEGSLPVQLTAGFIERLFTLKNPEYPLMRYQALSPSPIEYDPILSPIHSYFIPSEIAEGDREKIEGIRGLIGGLSEADIKQIYYMVLKPIREGISVHYATKPERYTAVSFRKWGEIEADLYIAYGKEKGIDTTGFLIEFIKTKFPESVKDGKIAPETFYELLGSQKGGVQGELHLHMLRKIQAVLSEDKKEKEESPSKESRLKATESSSFLQSVPSIDSIREAKGKFLTFMNLQKRLAALGSVVPKDAIDFEFRKLAVAMTGTKIGPLRFQQKFLEEIGKESIDQVDWSAEEITGAIDRSVQTVISTEESL